MSLLALSEKTHQSSVRIFIWISNKYYKDNTHLKLVKIKYCISFGGSNILSMAEYEVNDRVQQHFTIFNYFHYSLLCCLLV